MFHLRQPYARIPWIAVKQFPPIHLRPLHVHDLADKAPLPCSSSPNLTVSYLMSSCGLSQETALSVANKINLKTTGNANSILNLLRAHGFTTSHFASILTKLPRLLFYNAESNIKPKLEFFIGAGVSNDSIVRLITTMPDILRHSLERKLRPNFEMLKTICANDKVVLGKTTRFLCLLQRNFEKEILPNLNTLQVHRVPTSNIAKFTLLFPQALLRNPVKFSESVVSLKEMGFDPTTSYFIRGLGAILLLNKITWERRLRLYQSLGWSTEETISAFKKFPICMTLSDEKIKRAIGVFSEKLKCNPSVVATHPVLLSYSVEKKVVPRHNVMKILAFKGLKSKKLSITTIMCMSEKIFFKKYILKYKDQVPEILEAYKDNLDSMVSRSISSH